MTNTQAKQPYVRFFVSDWLGGTRGMRANEIGVYITLIALMYDRQAPLPEDVKRLSRQCGCTPKTFSETLELLVDDGKIQRTEDGLWNKRVEKEFVFREKKSHDARAAAKKRHENPSENNVVSMRPQCDRNATALQARAVFHIPDTLAKEANVTRARKSEFEKEFWPVYPHKIGKAAALKAYRSARDRASAEDIISGVRRYIADKPPDRAWCNPSTFLNQDRWTDEPASGTNPATGKPWEGMGAKRSFAEIRASMERAD